MNDGFMGTFITVYHVGADGRLTEIRTKEDVEKVLEEDDDNRMP